jgi:hypothetical protein
MVSAIAPSLTRHSVLAVLVVSFHLAPNPTDFGSALFPLLCTGYVLRSSLSPLPYTPNLARV